MNAETAFLLASVFCGTSEPARPVPKQSLTAQADLCRCGVSCSCADSAGAARSVQVAVRNTATRQNVTWRQPVGDHTHTCMNNNCKFYRENGVRMAWDHKASSSHNCPVCSTYQNVQDDRKQMIPVIRTETIPQTAPRAAPAFVWPVASTSNCANGNCAAPQTFRYR